MKGPKERRGAGREQVLSTATRLFTHRGAANVGINEVTATAGVARMTLYNNFPSKEALIAEVYRDMAKKILQDLTDIVITANSEEEKVLFLFEHFCEKRQGRRGCPMIHASLQAEETIGKVYGIVQSYKRQLRGFIYDQLDETRACRDELADQILLLLDGAVTESYLKGAVAPVAAARRAATILLRNMP